MIIQVSKQKQTMGQSGIFFLDFMDSPSETYMKWPLVVSVPEKFPSTRICISIHSGSSNKYQILRMVWSPVFVFAGLRFLISLLCHSILQF